MSRNIGGTCCHYCGSELTISGPEHDITKEEAGCYFDEYRGMKVADAVCPHDLSKYLAWIDTRRRSSYPDREGYREGRPVDISFRSSFNDEPGVDDLPEYQVVCRTVYERVGRYVPEHDAYGRCSYRCAQRRGHEGPHD